MGSSLSVNRNEPLLRYIRSLSVPEEALTSERALSLVTWEESSPPHFFHHPHPPTLQDDDEPNQQQPNQQQQAQQQLSDSDSEEKDLEDEDTDASSLSLPHSGEALSGRKDNVFPILFGSLVLWRRVIILEHIRIVLIERRSNSKGEKSAVTEAVVDMRHHATQGEDGIDLSLRILGQLSSLALGALQSVGKEVTRPVVSGLREMAVKVSDKMEIGSLGTESLDDMMDFLLSCYDEHNETQALEALCLLGMGRGSVFYLLQLAIKMFENKQLLDTLKSSLTVLLDKCSREALRVEEMVKDASEPELQRKVLYMRRKVRKQLVIKPPPRSEGDDESNIEGYGEDLEEEEEEEEEEIKEEEVESSIVQLLAPNEMLNDLPTENGLLRVDENRTVFYPSKVLHKMLTHQISHVACSQGHLLVVTHQKQVFARGDNKYGQCGISSKTYLEDFVQVDFEGQLISRVVAAESHSLFLADNGSKLFTCGRNHHGQLGHGTTQTRATPTPVQFTFTKPIKYIAAGHAHSAFVLADNEVYGFGKIKGRATLEPTLVFCCESTAKVVGLASGKDYCVALEESLVPLLASGASSASLLGAGKKKRKKKRKKTQFRVITCLAESEQDSYLNEPAVFHAQSALQVVPTQTELIVLLDAIEEDQQQRVAPTPSPRISTVSSSLLAEHDRLASFSEPNAGISALLWSLEKFPVSRASQSKFENIRLLLFIMERIPDDPELMVLALRVLQKHCFVPSLVKDDEHVSMHDLKQFLFRLAKSEVQVIKEEAIRAIGNGFAFLSPTAAELASFMSTITNMTYLSRFATLKFWSELFAQEQQDTALILIDRLVELASKDTAKQEVVDLLMAMQRSLLVHPGVESEIIFKYACALSQASIRLMQQALSSVTASQTSQDSASGMGVWDAVVSKLEASIVQTLAWPCVLMLQHPRLVELDEECVDNLLALLRQVDAINSFGNVLSRSWFADFQWAIVFLLISKVCPSNPTAKAQPIVGYTTLTDLNRTTSFAATQADQAAVVNVSAAGSGLTGGKLSLNIPPTPTGAAIAGMPSSPPPPPLSTRTTSSLNLNLLSRSNTDLTGENSSAMGKSGVNRTIFNSGFCSDAEYDQRMKQFFLIVEDAEHPVMNKVSKMNKMKFRNKAGAEQVWEALRAIFAAIKLFDHDDVKTDAEQSAMKILRWINQTKQALEDVDYESIGRHVVERTAFLLRMNNMSEHSLFQFVQQYDHSQLQLYEQELQSQKDQMEQQLRGFVLFEQLARTVKVSDVRRHVIFSFTEYAVQARPNPQIQALISQTIDALLQDFEVNPVTSVNAPITVALLDACISTNTLDNLKLVRKVLAIVDLQTAQDIARGFSENLPTRTGLSLLQSLDSLSQPSTPRGASVSAEQPTLGMGEVPTTTAVMMTTTTTTSPVETRVSRDPQSLSFLPTASGLPLTLGVQWSRQHKHPAIRLSKDGLCFQLPVDAPHSSCHTAATIRLSHALHSGTFYFQIFCTPGTNCPPSSLLYAVGLVPRQYNDWDGFSSILAKTLYTEQSLGLYIDMDASLCILLRHQDSFYVSSTECKLSSDRMIAAHRITLKNKPLCPAISLLSPGCTCLLKRFLIQSDTFRITLDDKLDLEEQLAVDTSIRLRPTPSQLSTRSVAIPLGAELDQDETPGASFMRRAAQEVPSSQQLRRSVEAGQNPEQDEDATESEKNRVTVSGPLSLGLTEEPELLVCGQNSFGELGLGDTKPHKDVTVSSLVKGLFPVQVVAGNEVTGVLTSQGEVYVWGYNKNGACSKQPTELDGMMDVDGPRLLHPYRVSLPTFVTRLCCSNGSEHMLAITSSGHLYGWGFNQYGQLGLGHKFEKIFQPTRVEGFLRDKRVTFAAASYSHSLALTEDGTVYGFGLNTRGQLGVGSTADMWTLPQKLTHLADVGRAVTMACGVEHSAVVMDDGALYTFGRNDCGQLGIDDMNKQLSALPVRVADGLSSLQSLRCEAVACGYYFTVVIADGTLHAFGKNEFGQLGVGHNQDVYAPVPVLWADDDDRFVAIACGTGHSVAATASGRIIAWGRNKDGGLGNGTTVDHPFPVEICSKGDISLSLRDQRPLHIAAGFHHTCILVGSKTKYPGGSVPSWTGHVSWGIRALKAAVVGFSHYLNSLRGDEAALIYTVDWVLRQVRESYSTCVKCCGTKVGGSVDLCPRHNGADISMCCLEERRMDALAGWITGIVQSGKSSPGLYLIYLLQLLLDLATKYPMLRNYLHSRRPWAVEMLFNIGFTVGYPARSSLAFDILAQVLPHVPIQDISEMYSIKELLLCVGRGDDLVLASEVVALLRTLLASKEQGWSMCVNRALLHSLGAQIPRLPEDVEDFSIFNENKERYWAMMGALAVLGAADGALYNGGPVSVVSSGVDGQDGILDHFRPHGPFHEVARVLLLPGRSSVVVRKLSELTPKPKVSFPVKMLARPERILALLVNLVQQSVNIPPTKAGLQNVKAACAHEIAKAKASRVIDSFLRNNPTMVQLFVSNGHLQAVTSLLAAPRGRLDDVSIRLLQKRFMDLSMLYRLADGTGSADDLESSPRGPSRHLSKPGFEWVCPVCTYKNPMQAKACRMCFARVSTDGTAKLSQVRERLPTEDGDSLLERVEGTSRSSLRSSREDKKRNQSSLSRHVSSASMHAGDVQTSYYDQVACSWSFESSSLPDNKKTPVEIVVEDKLQPAEDVEVVEGGGGDDAQGMERYLVVPANAYLKFRHCFPGNGSPKSVYLNQYSVILDVNIPSASMKHDFVSLLQTNVENDSLADWYVKGDGSVGCIEYSVPGTIKPDTWNRLAMTADLTKGEISYFVNGQKVVSLVHQGTGKNIPILEDDRWAMDASFCLFRDVDQLRDAPPVRIAKAQLRSYAMSEAEVGDVGAFDEQGIPLPKLGDLAERLSQELKLPKAWCVRALEATDHSLPKAQNWLRSNEQALIARTVAEARMLTALGYSKSLCAHAICTTGSLADAIRWLLNHEEVKEHDLNISRIMEECSKDDVDGHFNNDLLAINLAEDDQDAHNKTYEIYDSTRAQTDSLLDTERGADAESPGMHGMGGSSAGFGPSSSRSVRLNLPPLGAGVRQINAEMWETARQLFISHARQATVSILENSLVVQTSKGATLTPRANRALAPDGNETIIEDMQQKLLAVDGTGRNFLRNYIRAFPDSIRKDIRSGTVAHEVDPSDPIQVLRRKLLLVFKQEVEKKLRADFTAVTFERALLSWYKYHRRKAERAGVTPAEGTQVWWIEQIRLEGAPEANLAECTSGEEPGNIVDDDDEEEEEEDDDDVMDVDRGAIQIVVQTGRVLGIKEVNPNSASFENSSSVSNSGADQDKEEIARKKKLEEYQQQQEEFQQRAVVLYDFVPQRKGDLPIKKGDIVLVLGATKSGWGRAKDMKSGAVGTIPLNYVDAIGEEYEDPRSSNKHNSMSTSSANPASKLVKRVEISVLNPAGDQGSGQVLLKKPEDLLFEEPPSGKEDRRIKKVLQMRSEEEAWRNSVLRSLSEDVLHELVLLARGPWQFLPGGLQAGPSVQFHDVWSDKYTRTYEQTDPVTKKKKEIVTERPATIRIWRPFADSGFSILGDVATSATEHGENDQPPPVTVVSDDDGMGGKTTTASGLPLLVPPVRYKLIWQDIDAENDEHVSFWQPVPPEGYVALGCVAVKGHSKKEPDPKREGLQQLRCVHQSCVQLSTLQHGLWSYRPGDKKKVEEGSSTSGARREEGEDQGDDSDGGGNLSLNSLRRRAKATSLRKSKSAAGAGSASPSSSAQPKSNSSGQKSGVSIWEIDNSSRTFVPVVSKQDQLLGLGVGAMERNREKSKVLSMNRVDASTIEARLCLESQKRSTEEETKVRMLHGLKLSTAFSTGTEDAGSLFRRKEDSGIGSTSSGPITNAGDGRSEELRPHHLGLASTTNSNHGSSELLLWILQLFSEFDSNEKNGMGRWARRVFSPQLVHALLRFSKTASPRVRIKAIRMLAMVIRRTPAESLTGKLAEELCELREQMETLYTRQAQRPKDGLLDEMPLFSSLLCALTEVFVSVSLTQRQKLALQDKARRELQLVGSSLDDTTSDEEVETKAKELKSNEVPESVTNSTGQSSHEYFEVAFDGALGIEILSDKDILIVHAVKSQGAAFLQGVKPGDIFWELNKTRITQFDRHTMWSKIKNSRPLLVTFLRDKNVSISTTEKESWLESRDMESDGGTEENSTALVLKKAREVAGGEAYLDPAEGEGDSVSKLEEDVLTSKENWFQQLSELAAIMEALVHRDRLRMPSEFLMAEDTFLKLVLSNHTAVVESDHPFSSKPIKGQVTIPGAEALMVRFDRRCSTAFGKTLQLSCNVKWNNVRRDVHVETLQGCFGGCSVHIPSNTMSYQFPVAQTMNWALHRSAEFKAPEIRISNNGRTASLKKDKVWQTVFSTTGFNSGINMWEVRVDRTGPSANIFFGVAMKSAKVNNYLGSDDKGWGWIGCMACWHGGRKVRHRFGKRLKQGDIVRITLDIPRRAMSIACNGEDWGVAFNRLPLPSTVLKPGNELVPTFSFYNKEDQITLLSGSSAVELETAEILHKLRSNFEQQHAMARITPRFVQNNNQTSEGGIGGGGGRSSSSSSSHSSSLSSLSSSLRRGSLTSRSRRSSRDSDSERSSSRRSRRSITRRNSSRGQSSGSALRSGASTSSTSSTSATGGGSNSQVDDQAAILSALGYPIDWCLQALNATDNDMNRAAEYLINHSERMAEESKQEAERAAVEAEEAVIAEEEEWLNQVNQILDLDQQEAARGKSKKKKKKKETKRMKKSGDEDADGDDDDGGGQDAQDDEEDDESDSANTAAAAAVAALQSVASSNRIVQREYPLSSTPYSEDEMETSKRSGVSSSKKSPKDKKRASNKEWGYRMTISPLFSRETTKKLALEPRNAARLEMFHRMFEGFSLEQDCELVRMVNEICSKQGEDPLTLSPNDLEPLEEELERYKALEGIPLLHLQLRFLLLRNFNRRLAHVLPLIDLSCPAHESALAGALRGVRGVVMSSVKKALFERVLADSHSGDDHWMQQNKVPTVTLDRNKAAQFLKLGKPDTKGTRTVFGQLFSQLHGRGSEESIEKNPLLAPTPAVKDASLLRNSHRAWYTILAGERADDYGGPYRDVFNQACQELLTPSLPLFLPCPNQVHNHGSDRGKFVPSALASSQMNLCMFEFVGKLMGIAMRTKNPFVLDLPAFVWKQLCNDDVTVEDLRTFDLDFWKSFCAVAEITDEEALSRLDLKFTTKGSDGRFVELVPGGNSTMVTLSRKEDYLRAVERYRLHELDRQCAAIARGLGTQVPRNLLSIFCADELELMVCGPPEVDVGVLKLNTIYGEGVSENTPSVQLFWQVMEEFSQEERQKYLRFVWGRSRLPSSTSDWERKHKINKFSKTPSDDYLPVGHTCFFSIDLPMYTSKQICSEKLLFAITNCTTIDADDTTVAREGGNFLRSFNQDDDEDDGEED